MCILHAYIDSKVYDRYKDNDKPHNNLNEETVAKDIFSYMRKVFWIKSRIQNSFVGKAGVNEFGFERSCGLLKPWWMSRVSHGLSSFSHPFVEVQAGQFQNIPSGKEASSFLIPVTNLPFKIGSKVICLERCCFPVIFTARIWISDSRYHQARDDGAGVSSWVEDLVHQRCLHLIHDDFWLH